MTTGDEVQQQRSRARRPDCNQSAQLVSYEVTDSTDDICCNVRCVLVDQLSPLCRPLCCNRMCLRRHSSSDLAARHSSNATPETGRRCRQGQPNTHDASRNSHSTPGHARPREELRRCLLASLRSRRFEFASEPDERSRAASNTRLRLIGSHEREAETTQKTRA